MTSPFVVALVISALIVAALEIPRRTIPAGWTRFAAQAAGSIAAMTIGGSLAADVAVAGKAGEYVLYIVLAYVVVAKLATRLKRA